MIVPSVSSIAKLTVAVLPAVSTVVVDAWVMVVTSSTASTVNGSPNTGLTPGDNQAEHENSWAESSSNRYEHKLMLNYPGDGCYVINRINR
jgi:heme A synthase